MLIFQCRRVRGACGSRAPSQVQVELTATHRGRRRSRSRRSVGRRCRMLSVGLRAYGGAMPTAPISDEGSDRRDARQRRVASRINTVADAQRLARSRVPRTVFDYIEGGAGSESTVLANQRGGRSRPVPSPGRADHRCAGAGPRDDGTRHTGFGAAALVADRIHPDDSADPCHQPVDQFGARLPDSRRRRATGDHHVGATHHHPAEAGSRR